MNCKIFINQKEIPLSEIETWEKRRLEIVAKKLNSSAKSVSELTLFKEQFSHAQMVGKLQPGLKLSFLTSKLMSAISFGKRKIALVEMFVEEDISAKEISAGIDELMTMQSKGNDFANLSANPDHYVLNPKNGTLEVIETTGGAPFPIQMFITFGEEKDLTILRDEAYPFQSVGIARLKDGTVIGGVRHQFKDEAKGFSARLAVEFPVATSDYFIRQHETHLACEWKNWFLWVLEKKTGKRSLN